MNRFTQAFLFVFLFTTLSFANSGGTITADGNYTVHTFLSNGTFEYTDSAQNATLLIVAGGGSGAGCNGGAGGGAGGLIYTSAYSLVAGNYSVVVGAGAAGGWVCGDATGRQGGNSSFDSLVAGGGGGGHGTGVLRNGGSGGGSEAGQAAGTGVSGQGNDGGQGLGDAPNYGAGGGGGAGAVGAVGTGTQGGNGGAGLNYTINGSNANYSCGGGGSIYQSNANGLGGCASAGNGATRTTYATAGLNGTGSGGGGGSNERDGAGAGGSGVVIIRYLNVSGTTETGNLTVLTSNSTRGTATGNSSDFVVPANKTIIATANVGFYFSNWSSSGNCTINSQAATSTVQVDNGTCTVTASFNVALPPTAPVVLTPTATNQYSSINISWQASTNQSPSTFYYNISLLNNDSTFNKTIAANVSTNTSYIWATAGTAQGYYKIRITTFDSNGLNASGDSGTFTIAAFTTTAISPTSGQSFIGNEILFQYSHNSIVNISCNLKIDGVSFSNQTGLANNYSYLATIANGSHSWVVNCSDLDGAGYTQQTANRTFTVNYYAFNTQTNLTTSPENVLESPQALFFDINGNLNVLYFTDENASTTARIKTISGSSVTAAANLTLDPPKQFFVVFRGASSTNILALNATDSSKAVLLTLIGNTLTQANYTFPSVNVLNLTKFDAYTYANTKAFPTLSLSASSYWLFTVPTATGSNVTKWNGSEFSTVQTFVNSVSGQYQTIANDSGLTTWLYIVPYDVAGNNTLHIYAYNGTAGVDIGVLDNNTYSAADLSGAMVGFEKYANKTYAYSTNITDRTAIYLLEGGKRYYINESISNPSHFLFTDEYTFIFFAMSGGDTYAYTCYFESTPTCSKFASSEYGIAVPYEQGFMSSAKRESNRDDTVVRGMVQSQAVVALNYNINTYDMKFICYDEQNDARKIFKQKTFTATTSTDLLNETWGYVLPSASIGTGVKRIFSTCQNGTQRLFLTGLASNFSIDEYTLISTAGVYYSFTVKDRYGSPIQDVKVSMLRFSTLKQAFVVVEQCLSDFNGGCTFFIEPYIPYKILIEATGYSTQYVDFIPSSVTTINIALDASGTSFSLPNYNYLFNDLTTSLTPIATLMNNATNITFTASSNGSLLEFYGMSVYRTINGTRTQVYSNNITTQPSGGSVLYEVNSSGRYDVQVWAKSQNFSVYIPFTRSYVFQIKSGLVNARDALIDSDTFSGWSLYFLGVFVTMLVVGFVSRYTIDGAGIVGLVVLWGFTMLNPSAIIYQAGSITITATIVSIITSIVAVSALYLRYSAQSGG